jgi:hypothetical protein
MRDVARVSKSREATEIVARLRKTEGQGQVVKAVGP